MILVAKLILASKISVQDIKPNLLLSKAYLIRKLAHKAVALSPSIIFAAFRSASWKLAFDSEVPNGFSSSVISSIRIARFLNLTILKSWIWSFELYSLYMKVKTVIKHAIFVCPFLKLVCPFQSLVLRGQTK